MAICPFAVQRLLPESATQPRIKPRVFIMHSAAGRGSLYNFFLNSSNLESHFWVGNDGTIEQYVDTEVRADANLKANSFAISVETESSPAATEPWTEAQAISLVRLGDWAATTHDIPRVQTPTWDGAGFGWHVMFGAPGPWTPVSKSCPGHARVEQAKNVIIPSIREAGRVLPPAEEGFMSALTPEEQRNAYRILKDLDHDYLTKGQSVRQVILETKSTVDDIASGKRPKPG